MCMDYFNLSTIVTVPCVDSIVKYKAISVEVWFGLNVHWQVM